MQLEDNYIEVCKRIRKRRKELGLSQLQLAELAQISPAHMSNIENGKKMLGLDIFMKLTEALDVSADWLLRTETNATNEMLISELSSLLNECTVSESEAILTVAHTMRKVFIHQRSNT